MYRLNAPRSLRAVTLLLGLLLPGSLLAGCSSGNGTSTTSSLYAGKSASATKMKLNALTADLQVKTASTGIAATGTLTLTDPTRAVIGHSRLIIATPNCTGTYDPKTGALNLTGSYEYPAGTAHRFTVVGTLPVPPSNRGSLTITVDGTAFGPFIFGDNTAPAGTGSTGTTGTTGTTGQGSLIVSGAAGTTYLVNGGFAGVASASKTIAAFTLNGVAYDGQYNAEVKADKASIGFDLFGLNVTAGDSFDIATSPRPFINGYDGTDAYLADSGTLTVTAVSDTSISFKFTKAHFKAAPGSTPPANQFTLDGSFTAPITQ